jgi:hypothetical protein
MLLIFLVPLNFIIPGNADVKFIEFSYSVNFFLP